MTRFSKPYFCPDFCEVSRDQVSGKVSWQRKLIKKTIIARSVEIFDILSMKLRKIPKILKIDRNLAIE